MFEKMSSSEKKWPAPGTPEFNKLSMGDQVEATAAWNAKQAEMQSGEDKTAEAMMGIHESEESPIALKPEDIEERRKKRLEQLHGEIANNEDVARNEDWQKSAQAERDKYKKAA